MTPAEPALVPELLVEEIDRSLDFWCGLCGFEIRYQRRNEGFAYIAFGTAHLMLEQEGVGRNWVTGEFERPLGRGINLQVAVTDIGPILSTLRHAAYPLFMEPESKWYAVSGVEEAGVEQFLVADPDGYLVRFQTSVRRRPIVG